MTRFVTALCLALCVTLWTERGLAADRTLTDERGASVTLPQVDKGFYRYLNARFAFGVDVPALFTKAVVIPDNNDGIILEDDSGGARFRASGGNVIDGKSLKQRFEADKKDLGKAVAYAHLDKNFYTLSWTAGEDIHYRKVMLASATYCDVELAYPAARKKEFDALVGRAAKSLAWSR